MSEQKNKKIIKNTVLLYVRMISTMLITLYTSRIILNVLGVVDYGVYNVVGGIVTMFSFLNGAMTNGTLRFLSFELGKENIQRLKRVFSTTLNIHILIGLIILFFAETIGLWLLNHKLNIPQDRIIAANWVYQFSILTFLVSVIQVPYNASIIAHERMNFYAYISIVEVTLKLLIVYLLTWIKYDELIGYGILYFFATVIIAIIYIVYCSRNYRECKYQFVFDKQLFKDLSTFAGWNLYGNITCVIADQGVNMILNINFGPIVNAARGISYQINNAMRNFSNSFQIAANPQIIKSFATGEKEYMMNLILLSSKFSFFLLYIVALPVFIETDFILKIWLKTVPDYTSLFCRLIIINGLVDVFSGALQTAANATGKIKLYQFSEGTIILLVLPVSFVFYRFGFAPETTFYVGIIAAILLQFTRLFILKKIINLDMKSFVINILLKSFLIAIISAIIPYSLKFLIDSEILRFFSVCFVALLSSMIIIYLFGLNKIEKTFIKTQIIQVFNKKNNTKNYSSINVTD